MFLELAYIKQKVNSLGHQVSSPFLALRMCVHVCVCV